MISSGNLRFGIAAFLGAFLLFLVQPLIGKRIVAWFGGSAAVWTACLMLFQVLLLAGYAYAHWLGRGGRLRIRLHCILLLLAIPALFLLFPPAEYWKPETGSELPLLRVLMVLGATVGLPYFLLASAAPLLQVWYDLSGPGRSPYRLYALSNVGSLLGLLGYPFVVEPLLALGPQAMLWRVVFIGFVAATLVCVWKLPGAEKRGDTASTSDEPIGTPPKRGDQVFWLGLTTCGSIMLLATTNLMCEYVAAVPLLWVLPLAIYLVSFILCFGWEWLYQRVVFIPALAIAFGLAVWQLYKPAGQTLTAELSAYSAALFVGCMVCHGELVRLRPPSRFLTRYYLLIAAGGASGGILVSVIAPLLFPLYWEYQLGLAACVVLFLLATLRDRKRGDVATWQPAVVGGGLLVLLLVMKGTITWQVQGVLASERSFHGVLRVTEAETKLGTMRILFHGSTRHGLQLLAPDLRDDNVSYYGNGSGAQLALSFRGLSVTPDGAPRLRRVGVVGLGIGSVTTFLDAGEQIRYFELDPLVERVARDHFYYLADGEAKGVAVDVVIGDARLSLEQELRQGGDASYDVLILDAFSNGAIPPHLLTQECMALYFQTLAPDGILAVHLSHHYLDLRPPVFAAADRLGKKAFWVETERNLDGTVLVSDWVLVSSNQEFMDSIRRRGAARDWSEKRILWTDDFSNLWSVIK